jgi:hypothetical protein
MLNTNDIQEAIIKYLKADATLVAMLKSSGEIKEDNWQGVAFSYPAVRVDIRNQLAPNASGNSCGFSLVQFSVLCYSEQKSSKESNDIGWRVLQLFQDKSFSYDGLLFTKVRSNGLIPAARKDDKTWVTEVNLESRMQLSI